MSPRWQNSQEEIKQFHRIAYQLLSKDFTIDPTTDGMASPWENTDYMDVFSMWKEASGDLDHYDKMQDAAFALARFGRENIGPQELPNSETKLSVQVTRNYGEMSITFGTEGFFIVESEWDRRHGWNQLMRQVTAQHDVVSSRLHMYLPDRDSQQVKPDGMVTVKATKVYKFNDKGKDWAKIKCGQWMEYGVPVYPEFLEALKIDLPALPYGDSPYDYMVDVMLKDNGQPAKVVSIHG